MNQPEFNQYAAAYDHLIKDPIRDCFSGTQSTFFHLRKRDLIRDYFRRVNTDIGEMRYLDLGCGKGDLLRILQPCFASVAGCDLSADMLSSTRGVEARVQENCEEIPFDEGAFDFVTAVCVYHHVPPSSRMALTREVYRVLRPGGVFAIIEHNPYNPITRLIVSRTPVDTDALLVKAAEASKWMHLAGFVNQKLRYFLYLPEPIYRWAGGWEYLLRRVPLGGQYAIFGIKEAL